MSLPPGFYYFKLQLKIIIMFVHNVQFPQRIVAFWYIDKLVKTRFDFIFVYFFLISATFEVFSFKLFLW